VCVTVSVRRCVCLLGVNWLAVKFGSKSNMLVCVFVCLCV